MPAAHPSKLTQQHSACDTSPEVPRHQAWQSQLATVWTANEVACPSAPRHQPHAYHREAHGSSQWPKCQPPGAKGQLADWQDWPTDPSACWYQAGMQEKLCPGSLGCQSAWCSKASGVLSSLFLLSIIPHELVPVKILLYRKSK